MARRLPAVLALALSALLLLPQVATAARPAPPAPPPAGRTFAVSMPGAPWDLSGLDTLSSQLGRRPGVVGFYVAWAYDESFPTNAAYDLYNRGITPEITWEPWDPAAGTTQPAYTLDRVAAGAHDAYLTRWARQIRTFGKPVIIRLAHEMNGGWYPWAESANGNGPGDYVAAWRHVVDLFRAQRVKNVTWRWSPNVPYQGSTSLGQLYPGDAYVDSVALDGYNWGGSANGPWTSFAEVFSPGIAQLQALTSKPIYVGETGCPEQGGDKAAWIRDMFGWLAVHPEVRGFLWFDYDKEQDWRIDSSPASLAAFRDGLATFS